MGEKCCHATENTHCVKGVALPFLLSSMTVRKCDIVLLKASTDGSGCLCTLQQQGEAEEKALTILTTEI